MGDEQEERDLNGCERAAIPLYERPQRRSLFDSMSNHIANSVN